jgi:starvation-inducible DNA-binding protein
MVAAVNPQVETNVNIALADEQRKAVIEILNRVLADQHILYTKTRNYHWNIVGSQFFFLHGLFEEQYDSMAEAIDETAERVRQLGGKALGTLTEFLEQARLAEQPGIYPIARNGARLV